MFGGATHLNSGGVDTGAEGVFQYGFGADSRHKKGGINPPYLGLSPSIFFPRLISQGTYLPFYRNKPYRLR